MESTRAAGTRLTPDAAEFVRFCYRRRAVGWPDLYDEMCAVASRGLFRGWGSGELAEHGVGFGLFELAELAALTRQVVAEEQSQRRGAGAAARSASPVVIEVDAAPLDVDAPAIGMDGARLDRSAPPPSAPPPSAPPPSASPAPSPSPSSSPSSPQRPTPSGAADGAPGPLLVTATA